LRVGRASALALMALILAGCSSTPHGGGHGSTAAKKGHSTPVTLGAPVTSTSTSSTTLPPTTTTLPKTVNGSNGGLTIALTVDPIRGTAGQTVRFILNAKEAQATGALFYNITYGDGESGSFVTPAVCKAGPGKPATQVWNLPHTYATPGTYTATVTVGVNCSDDKATTSVAVTAVAPS
jgi:hypothetical protein